MHFHCLHGAWHGSWVWQPLARLLNGEGHTVSAPDLPGLGSRADELDKSINLESHIDASAPASPCWVVAHSYAGIIAKALRNRHPAMVQGIVLIEALWPVTSGQSVLDLLAPDAVSGLLQKVTDDGEGWKILPPPVSQFAISDSHLQSVVEMRLTAQPFLTFKQPLEWADETVPVAYLIASDREPQPYQQTATRLAAMGTNVVSMPGGHNLMLTNTAMVHKAIMQAIISTARSTAPFSTRSDIQPDERRS